MGDEWFSIDLPVGPDAEWEASLSWFEGDLHGPTRLVLQPKDPDNRPPGGISQTVLREIRISDAVKMATEARQNLENHREDLPEIDWDVTAELLRRLSADGITKDYLAALSWAYSAAANQPKPLERLAELVDKSPAAIKNHLWQATRKGLLHRSPGRAGGAVTQKAVDILGELPLET